MEKIATLVEKIYEDLGLQCPRLREAGHQVHIIGQRKSEAYIGKNRYPQPVEYAAANISVKDSELLVMFDHTIP